MSELVIAVVLALFVSVALCFVCKRFYGSSAEQYECQSLKPEMAKKKSIVAIDCEMVRCLPTKEWQIKARKTRKRNKKEVAVAARCAVVDYNGRVVYDEYICPPMEVEDWKGYSKSCYHDKILNGVPFYEAREEILGRLNGKLVVVHHLHHDFDALQIYFDITKERVRDTSMTHILRHMANESVDKQYVSLKVLAKNILGKDIHGRNKKPHDPVEDARIAMELYRKIEREFEENDRQYANTDYYESDPESDSE